MQIIELKNEDGSFFFRKIDLKYSYNQILLQKDTRKHCNFYISIGKLTGTYRFKLVVIDQPKCQPHSKSNGFHTSKHTLSTLIRK